MGLLKLLNQEFSFVDGFGDDVRAGTDHGFPANVMSAINERYPSIRIVYHVPDKKLLIFTKGDRGDMFLIREAKPGETWAILDHLDYANWASRNLAERARKRGIKQKISKMERDADEKYQREAMANCDPDFAGWLIRKYKEKILNTGDPYPTISVPSSAPF